MGVIPLPPANATNASESLLPSRNTKRPSGGAACSSPPSAAVSFNQFETTPPGSRLTVIRNSFSAGAEDIE